MDVPKLPQVEDTVKSHIGIIAGVLTIVALIIWYRQNQAASAAAENPVQGGNLLPGSVAGTGTTSDPDASTLAAMEAQINALTTTVQGLAAPVAAAVNPGISLSWTGNDSTAAQSESGISGTTSSTTTASGSGSVFGLGSLTGSGSGTNAGSNQAGAASTLEQYAQQTLNLTGLSESDLAAALGEINGLEATNEYNAAMTQNDGLLQQLMNANYALGGASGQANGQPNSVLQGVVNANGVTSGYSDNPYSIQVNATGGDAAGSGGTGIVVAPTAAGAGGLEGISNGMSVQAFLNQMGAFNNQVYYPGVTH